MQPYFIASLDHVICSIGDHGCVGEVCFKTNENLHETLIDQNHV